jgi:hypothetical protein
VTVTGTTCLLPQVHGESQSSSERTVLDSKKAEGQPRTGTALPALAGSYVWPGALSALSIPSQFLHA